MTAAHLAIVASRDGELRTVTTEDAAALIAAGGWMLVCHDPDTEPPTAHPRNLTPGMMDLRIDLTHHHDYGRAQDHCPKPSAVTVPVDLDHWTTATLADITETAATILDAPRVSWTLHTWSTPRGTTRARLEIQPYSTRGQGYPLHVAVITLPAVPVFAVAELLRHTAFDLRITTGQGRSYRTRTDRLLQRLRELEDRIADLREDDEDDKEGDA